MSAPVLAFLVSDTSSVGYVAVVVFVGVESIGIPLPGETALVAAGILASKGNLSIEWVIALASIAAIVGDNIGYVLGRTYGRKVLESHRLPFYEHRMKGLDQAERFFARHGGKAVFLGRWFAGLRITAAWLAGANHMHWRRFLVYNALGGITWSLSVGLAAYYAGEAAGHAIEKIGVIGLGVFAVIAIALYLLWRRRRSPDGQGG